MIVLLSDVHGQLLLTFGGELGIRRPAAASVLVVLVLLLLLALLEQLHFFLQVLLQAFVHLASGNALNHSLILTLQLDVLFVDGLRYLVDGLLSLNLLDLVDDHALQLVYFGKVGDEYLYELELKLLLDDLVADVGAVDQLYEQLLELLRHLEVLYDVVVPLPEYLVLDHLHLVFALTVFL